MNSKFPFSMENIPRQSGCLCFSLRFASIFSGLIVIIYSVIALAQLLSVLSYFPAPKSDDWQMLLAYSYAVAAFVSQAATLFLSAIMVVGAIREKAKLIKPWVIWISIQVMISIVLFVMWSTMNMIDQFSESNLMIYVTEFLILLIRIYMLMLVGSYYKMLEEEKDERRKQLLHDDAWYSAVV